MHFRVTFSVVLRNPSVTHIVSFFQCCIVYDQKINLNLLLLHYPQEKKANKKKKKGVIPGGGLKANMKDNLDDYGGGFDDGYGNEFDDFM